ncbi:MAG: group III truncated hemoglobin [Rhizobiales bacterium]|nr:group III truncated hemoglobin [Hyphomicrobiales bacterium]
MKRLVESFYGRAAADPLLGPVFARAIPDWAGHYQIVQNFWSRTLLGTARYSGMPFAAHIPLQLKPEHFTRWVALFKETAAEVLEPVAAARAIAKVEHMSTCFQAGLFPPDLGACHAHGVHAG